MLYIGEWKWYNVNITFEGGDKVNFKDNENERLAHKFEEVVLKIFQFYGFESHLNSHNYGVMYDISANKDNLNLAIEVKYSKNIESSLALIVNSATKLASYAMLENKLPVLVVAGLISQKTKTRLSENEISRDVIVCDIQNLLFLVDGNEQLKLELISLLSFSVDELELLAPPEKLGINSTIKNQENSELMSLINELQNWQCKGKNNSNLYETLCTRVLKFLFFDDLSLWKEQEKSNDGLFRFDLICKIKDGVDKEFWKVSEKYFNSKYIIFEFKNYTEHITQKEIFTTEKYLYAKGLRNIAVIISVLGESENAKKAIRGILRENGKVILSITNEDLIYMLELKLDNTTPADYLSQKLDDLLIDLEK